MAEGLGRDVRWVALDLDQFAESLIPVIGESAARELAIEYRLTAEHPALADTALDYDGAPRELGVTLTPLAHWAATQDWATASAQPPTA